MNIRRPGIVLDLYLFLITVFGTLIITRGLALLVSTEFYFTFQSLFTDRPAQNLIVALLSKMVGPLACGFALGWFISSRVLYRDKSLKDVSALKRRFMRQWSPTIFLGGFSAAFVSAWPIIVYWDLLSNPVVTHLKPIFFILYLLYMFGYGYIALLGFLGAVFVRERFFLNERNTLVSLPELSRVGALWILNSGIASAALQIISK